MFEEEIWSTTLAAARAGDIPAAVRLAQILMEWAERALDAPPGRRREELVVAFVEHLFRDNFSHLPEGEPAAIEAHLRASLETFLSDWES